MIHNAITYTLQYGSKPNISMAADTITEVMTRIKLIGSIKDGEKLNVKNMAIQPKSLWTSITRAFYQENRDDTTCFISSSINRGFEIIDSKLASTNTSDKLLCRKCIADIRESINGIKNLQNTYHYDRRVCCLLQTIIERITNQLCELYEKHQWMFEHTKEDNVFENGRAIIGHNL